MTGRDRGRGGRGAGSDDPSAVVPDDAATISDPASDAPRPAAVPAETRAGEDTRRRGWFWHWNSIVTQYSPLLGLKGVGLLNSYTVWTDRREESPHRGYAFPSQQSEADFYGEDRAELIAINKILVALDLIEIRKEMVLRTDPQGRRWRVPHNFYRVKDQGDGFTLSGRDVLRVAALAERDKAVYRLVRRVFSPRFSPIDGDNVWHRILPEVRQTALWQRLAARATGEEDRASARTRAGHAARRAAVNDAAPGLGVPIDGDGAATVDTPNDTSGVDEAGRRATSVASTNRGSGVGVGSGNDGSTASDPTSVDGGNDGTPTGVEPSNTTYDQSPLTTTTTRRSADENGPDPVASATVDKPAPGLSTARASFVIPVDGTERDAAESAIDPPPGGLGAAPADAPGEGAAIRAFEDANARPSTPAERTLLRGIAARFDPAAAANGGANTGVPASGWAWLTAAVYEAVEAGSAFVAPRRLREILGRWERDGFPIEGGDAVGGRRTGGGGGRRPAAGRPRGTHGRGEDVDAPSRDVATDPPTPDLRPPTSLLAAGPDPMLPHGHGGRRTWAFAVGLLGEALDRESLAALVAGTAIVGYRDGEVLLAAPDPVQAERLATTHRELVARKLSEAMRRPVRVAVVHERPEVRGQRSEADGGEGPGSAVATEDDGGLEDDGLGAGAAAGSFSVAECGLPSGQVWSAVLAELAGDAEVGRATFEAWLRGTTLLGRGGDGAAGTGLVVGVPHDLARRRVATRFLPALRRAVATVVGAPLPVEVVVAREWPARPSGPEAGIERRVGA